MKCTQTPFEHNKSIFHIGQCQFCYSKQTIEEVDKDEQQKQEFKMFAMAAMQGLLSNPKYGERYSFKEVADIAINHANELLQKLKIL